MIKWIKYRIALLLNKNPERCWAELVMWAEGYKDLRDCNFKSLDCVRFDEYSYCGKCIKTGKINDDTM